LGANQNSPSPWDGTIWNNPSSGYPAGVSHHTYYSQLMKALVGYNIYLPPQYTSNSNQRFPVLYHFHGRGGNENTDAWLAPKLRTMIDSSAVNPMIMVFVNGGVNSKYMDSQPGSPAFPSYRPQSSIVGELIPTVDATYRTIRTPTARAVMGFSMGGMGCELMMFKYPQMFDSAYCYAPAIDDNSNNIMKNERMLMANMFNDDVTAFQNETVWVLSTNNASDISGLPIHISVGSNDWLLSFNQQMDSQMTSLGIAHDPLQVVSGCGHDLNCLVTTTNCANFAFIAASQTRLRKN
jgi:enterochelin esterase-like enzyme